jgi:hypothetical protein
MAYVSDCALPVNADALLLVNGLKNIVAFGFLYAVVPWVRVIAVRQYLEVTVLIPILHRSRKSVMLTALEHWPAYSWLLLVPGLLF